MTKDPGLTEQGPTPTPPTVCDVIIPRSPRPLVLSVAQESVLMWGQGDGDQDPQGISKPLDAEMLCIKWHSR